MNPSGYTYIYIYHIYIYFQNNTRTFLKENKNPMPSAALSFAQMESATTPSAPPLAQRSGGDPKALRKSEEDQQDGDFSDF